MPVRIGLVLSGGGLRGASHLGVLQQLVAHGIPFEIMRDIPREEWHTFLDDFSRQHRDEPVTLEKSDMQDGLRVAARAAPLKSASHNRAGEQISITVGEITYTVTRPDGIALDEAGEGSEEPQVAIHITGGGQHVVLRVGSGRSHSAGHQPI